MTIRISGLNELRERLERLRPEDIMAQALAEQAQRMAARVREGLSEQPGGAGHDEPWLQSGALRDSVGAQAEGLQAVIGSSDPAAVPQELGTARMPPRPFLLPVAASMGEEAARAVAAAVVAALRGDSPDAGSAYVDLCGDGPDGGEPLDGGAVADGDAPASNTLANATRVGSAHPAANGASPDRPARNLFTGPSITVAPPLYNQDGSVSRTQTFVPLPAAVQTLTSSVDIGEVTATAGPGVPDQLTPAGEALRKQLAQMSQQVVDNYMSTNDGSSLARATLGTVLHNRFAKAVRDLNLPGVEVEQSFSLGDIAKYGSDGSVRTDVILREGGKVTAIFDYKTGAVADDYSSLSASRTRQILQNVLGPEGISSVPVIAIRVKVR